MHASRTLSLNAEQQRAVDSASPRILVIAGAGTGKTRVLTERVSRLLDERVSPEKILVVTFTRKATAALRSRLEQLAGPAAARVEVRTMHSWAARLCRAYATSPVVCRTPHFTVWDGRDQEDVLRAAAKDCGIATWAKAKVEKLWTDDLVRRTYRDRQRAANALDYDDLERLALRLIVEHEPARLEWTQRYRHVLVDEFQDTNLAQVAILEGLTPPNFFVVGDARQSIYRFRGAEVRTILDYATDAQFEVVNLVTNYRSIPAIVEWANGAADARWAPMVSGRPDAQGEVLTRAWDPEPEKVAAYIRDQIVSRDGCDGLRPGDFAVLARTWREVSAVVRELDAVGVPAKHCGPQDDPWSTDDGRALARVLLLAGNPYDDELAALVANWGSEGFPRFEDLRRTRSSALVGRRYLLQELESQSPEWASLGLSARSAGEPTRKVAERALRELGVLARLDRDNLDSRKRGLLDCLEDLAPYSVEEFRDWWAERSIQDRVVEAEQAQAVQAMTIHAAKGLEFPRVAFVGVRDGAFPSGRGDDEAAEELRLYYVACTRAQDGLLVSRPLTYRQTWEKWDRPADESPFTERCRRRG